VYVLDGRNRLAALERIDSSEPLDGYIRHLSRATCRTPQLS
jgi:hypothetical protein